MTSFLAVSSRFPLLALQAEMMYASRLVLALLSVLVISAASRKLLIAEESGLVLEGGQAEEHQRILAELEEVHQLRERMLQEGKLSAPFCACHARVSLAQPRISAM